MGGKKALLTGACGFSGTHMLEHLINDGWEVVATDIEPQHREKYYQEEGGPTSPAYYRGLLEDHDVEFIPADLTKPETLEPLFENHSYDAVFHVASMFDYFADRETLFSVNVEGGRNLAQLAADNDVGHFVHWSTLGVLGHAGFDEPKDESAPYHPHNRYCESKVEQEKALLKIAEDDGLPLTIMRPAPIYGPRHTYGVYHLLLVLSKWGFAPILRAYPRNKEPQFPSIHVHDLSRAALFLHEHRDESVGEIYNLTSDCIPQDDLIEFVANALGVKTKRVPIPAPVYQVLATLLRRHAYNLEKKAKENDTRTKIDAPMTEYLTQNMWFSNQKIKDLGFSFDFADPKKGLWEYITWCKARGMIA